MTVPPLPNDPPDWDAIARYRSGESVGDDARRIAAWLEANPVDASMLDVLDEIVGGALSGGAPRAEPDVEAALRSVRARLHESTPPRVLAFPGARRAPSKGGWVAGGLAAAAAIGALAVGIGRTGGSSAVTRQPDRGAPGSVIETAVGVRDSVRLPDGTRVVLAPASRLAISPSFGSTSREVTVQGTVWLAVRHDAARPFTVRAAHAVVRDVGTAFTVRTGAASDPVSVAVTEGQVELRAAAPASTAVVRLAVGDRGALTTDGRVSVEHGVVSDADVEWTRGRLVFRDASLDLVRAELRRWYGIDLQVADGSLATRRLTATFDGEPVDRVLEVIALALGARVERRDSVAVLHADPSR